MTAPRPLLSGIVVHWGTEAALARLFAAWPDDPRFELIVVDNGSDPERWPAAPDHTTVIRPTTNLGFAGGANRGAAVARADIVMILNPDAHPVRGALEALCEGFDHHPESAGLAPRLVGDDGSETTQWQLRRLPSIGDLIAQTFFVSRPRGPRRPPASGTPVEQPAAAALALRRGAFETVGGFDDRFFPAWFEDVDLARRLSEKGLVIRYWPRSKFVHTGGASVDALGYQGFLRAYATNLLCYTAKHHRRALPLLRASVALGAIGRALLVPLRRPRRATNRLAALRALAGVTRVAWSFRADNA